MYVLSIFRDAAGETWCADEYDTWVRVAWHADDHPSVEGM
jgi:hypothetical protein